MNIKIEQTLHGYEIGHQLLMSSSPLSSDAKQTLLVQSDLSGSNVDENFKTYLTGYPLSNYYALSRTWYADEMKRPGCVWTQTFLIAFADLGKIPNLTQLIKYFKRPVKDHYEEYGKPIFFDRSQIENKEEPLSYSATNIELLSGIYEHFDRTILLPSFTSLQHEQTVLQIWSNQWPRLRRNFYFCTGALSLKSLDGREFDLQVVPYRNLLSVEKQTQKAYSINYTDKDEILPSWMMLLFDSPKTSLRRFLWLYGSDIQGNRKNFKPLLLIYLQSINNNPQFAFVSQMIRDLFPSQNEALRLKSELFIKGSLFHFDERKVLFHLLNADQSDFNRLEGINLNLRLADSYKSGLLSFSELLSFYFNAPPNRLSDDLFDNLNINAKELMLLISYDIRFLDKFKSRLPELVFNDEVLRMSRDIQLKVLSLLYTTSFTAWDQLIFKLLKVRSDLIFDILNQNQQFVHLVIQWMDINNYSVRQDLEDAIFRNHRNAYLLFIRENRTKLSVASCNKIFEKLNFTEVNALGFNAANWITIYQRISNQNSRIFASCILLSFGFNRIIDNSAGIVLICFSDVYYYAKDAKVVEYQWRMLPVDMSQEEDDEKDPLRIIFDMINVFSTKKNDVPSWDYCELLIRTLVNKFIKYNWPRQAFLECLTSEHLTIQAIRYCLSFKKGIKFLKGILNDISKQKIKPKQHQIEFLKRIYGELS